MRSLHIFFVGALCLFLSCEAQVLSWPDSFFFNHTNVQIAAPNLEVPGYFAVDENYNGGSEAVYRSDGYYNGICGVAGGNLHTDCVQITTGGVRYVLNPQVGKCCRCCTSGCGTLASFWINTNAEFVSEFNVNGTDSYHWHITGNDVNSLFLSVSDSKITKITDGDEDNFTAIMSTYTSDVPHSLFDIPKGCDEIMCDQSIPVCAGEGAEPLSSEDLDRAKTWAPGQDFKGSDLHHASDMLNVHLDSKQHLNTVRCGAWSLTEMDTVQRWLASHAHKHLLKIYKNNNDPRAMTDGAGGSKEDLEATWEKMHKVAETSPLARQLLVTGRCRQSVMWYTHHLSAAAQEQFVEEGMLLPRLPTEDEVPQLDEEALEEMTEDEKWAWDVAHTMAACTQCHLN